MPTRIAKCIWLPISAILPLVAAISSAFAQSAIPYQPDENWQQVCKAAQAQPLAPLAPAGPLTPAQLPSCDEAALYYGIGHPPNYAAALQCGWYQRAHPQSAVGNMFYGPGVLAMLYANGRGVPRDDRMAIRFACENPWAAPAENAYRVGHLEFLERSATPPAIFDLCDDATSGLSGGFCASIQTRTRDAARARQIAALIGKFSPQAQSAFPALQAAQSAFEEARVANEIDLSGTLRGAFELEEEAKLRDQFLIDLQRFAKGDLPPASAADVAALTTKMNATLRQLQTAPPSDWQYATIKPAGILAAQTAWQASLDAWIKFAPMAYPHLSLSRIRAELIRLRLHQLRSLAK
ncbi:MAG TPA: DUF1311 domain-containing protein [Acidobacteriaceae bacterium]|jgi:hypothetical protein|nr:DUF1311 domain-containing protein [Acidobacteriaceae bacterium]